MRFKTTVCILIAISIFLPTVCIANSPTTYAIIQGHLESAAEGDSITVRVYRYGMNEFADKYVGKISNGNFKIIIEQLQGPTYVTIRVCNPYSTPGQKYLIEGGDDIRITGHNRKLIYSGRGSSRLKWQDSLNLIFYDEYSNRLKAKDGDALKQLASVYDCLDSICDMQLKYLSTKKSNLSPVVFTLLQMDLLAQAEAQKDYYIIYSNSRKDASTLQIMRQSLNGYHNRGWKHLANLIELHPDVAAASASVYGCIFSRYNIDSFLIQGKPFNTSQYVDYLIKNYPGLLREKLLVSVISDRRHRDSDLATTISKARVYIKNADFLKLVSQIGARNTAGVKAFNFNLSDSDGEMHRLSDYKSKVVVVDFWYTGCANCIGMNRKLKEIEQSFKQDTNLVFVSISTDPNKKMWMESMKTGKYTTDDRVNLYTNGQGTSYPMISYHSITAYPTLLLIDKEGNLAENVVDPRLDGGNSLIKTIKKELSKQPKVD